MQAIFGSGGAIARPLATALADYTNAVRCCSRSPHALPADTSGTAYAHLPTDLLDPAQVLAAVQDCEVAYLTAGLEYDIAVWRRDWPTLIANVLAACAKTGCRLTYFDSVYPYAKSGYAHLDETVPLDPPSQKGKVRKGIRETVLRAHAAGEVECAVAVAADFYGPGVENCTLYQLVIKKLAAGNSAQWLGDADVEHNYTHTPDAGKHTALLGNTPDAYGEVWHLPTDAPGLTAREAVQQVAQLFAAKPKLSVLPQWLWRGLATFNAQLREVYDIRDQMLLPYRFVSDKFERRFGVKPTPFAEGLAEVCRRAVAESK